MNDVNLILQATGNLDAKLSDIAKQLTAMGDRGAQVGKRTEQGLRAAINSAREMGRRVNEFIGAGLIGYRMWRSAVDAWSKAHEVAAARVNKANREAYDAAKRTYDMQVQGRAGRWERMTTEQQLRLAGVTDDRQIETIRKALGTHQGPHGDRIRSELFPELADQIGRQRLSPEDTGRMLERAVQALNRFGHVAGYGGALSTILSNGDLAQRGNADELALGLTLRRARLSDAERQALDGGLASGALGVGLGGELLGQGPMAAIAATINGLGGLGLRGAFEGWNPQEAGRLNHIGGVVTAARRAESETWALPAYLQQATPTAPTAPAAVAGSDADPTAGDWLEGLKSAFGELAAQAAAAAISIGAMTVAARIFGRAPSAPQAPAPALPGGGAAPRGGGGGRGWGRLAGIGGAAALALTSVVAATQLAGTTDGAREFLARTPEQQAELDAQIAREREDPAAAKARRYDEMFRRRALFVAKTPHTEDDASLRARAAAGDPGAQRMAELLELILAELKKPNPDHSAWPLAPLPEAQ